jgi:hypothetical protein
VKDDPSVLTAHAVSRDLMVAVGKMLNAILNHATDKRTDSGLTWKTPFSSLKNDVPGGSGLTAGLSIESGALDSGDPSVGNSSIGNGSKL